MPQTVFDFNPLTVSIYDSRDFGLDNIVSQTPKALGAVTNYSKYLSGDHWKKIKEKHCPPGSRCKVCLSGRSVHLHHLNYENIGSEKEGDFVLLCRSCHYKVHFSRKGNWRPHCHTLMAYQKLFSKRNKIRIKRMKYENMRSADVRKTYNKTKVVSHPSLRHTLEKRKDETGVLQMW